MPNGQPPQRLFCFLPAAAPAVSADSTAKTSQLLPSSQSVASVKPRLTREAVVLALARLRQPCQALVRGRRSKTPPLTFTGAATNGASGRAGECKRVDFCSQRSTVSRGDSNAVVLALAAANHLPGQPEAGAANGAEKFNSDDFASMIEQATSLRSARGGHCRPSRSILAGEPTFREPSFRHRTSHIYALHNHASV